MDTVWKFFGNTNNKKGSKVQVSPIRFVKSTKYDNGNDSGWLLVKFQNSTLGSLCERTKVQITETKNGRTYFKILDGYYQGKSASLKEENAKLYLSGQKPLISTTGAVLEVLYTGKKRIIYSEVRDELTQIYGRLSFNGNTVLISLSTVEADTLDPIPDGTYNILVPNVPHNRDYTEQYLSAYPNLKCHQVWFPIEYQTNNRFVHVGAISEGCITVLELKVWNKLYDYLISHRQTDSRYVGKLIIRKT